MRGLHGAGAVIFRGSLFVDLVNTASRDNVRSRSNQNHVEGRYDIFHFEDVDNEGVLQRYNSHTTSVLAASLHPSTSELPGDLRALKKATNFGDE
jgi:hypothetical protein